MSVLPQAVTINQYLADGATTIFNYSFYLPKDIDVDVYITPPNTTPVPSADIKILNTDYTVQGSGSPTFAGGTITFISGTPVIGSIVTLVRNVKNTIDTEYSQARNINGANLDDSFDRLMLCVQQNTTNFNNLGLQYIVNSFNPAPYNYSNLVPRLPDNYIWVGQNGGVVAALLEQNPNWSTLRTQLLSESVGTNGCSIIGYNDPNNANAPQLLKTFLDNLPSYILQFAAIKTGDIKPTLNSTAATGWIVWADGTIGSATSGASILASTTAQALYVVIWNGFSDANCPVTGGRGANALADFNANKKMALPATNGRTVVNVSGGTYTPGQAFGEATHVLSIAEMPSHDHPGSFTTVSQGNHLDDSNVSTLESPGVDPHINLTTTVAAQGGGGAHNNLQPSVAIYYHIKL